MSSPAVHQTGPRTPEGKGRCRLNAYRHGLTAKILVLTPDEQTAFDELHASLTGHYAPLGPVETQLVKALADSQWRLDCATEIERSIFALGLVEPSEAPTVGNPELDVAFAQGRTWLAQSQNLALLTLYEQRIHRRLLKDTQALAAEQARRIAAYEQAMAVAKRLYKAALAEGKPYQPELYFRRPPQTIDSVFSPDSVTREIVREALENAPPPPEIAAERKAA